ncbi:hypothetical protein HPP92_014551 [Vanilla planifolia]|uniref:Uncharacterized protein n=1 Tax=Vanilla planifolia TaxID=51239 RepID=A0A835UWC0_VANPL|nr:hypothetical protein HPP92_014551 [Vanilla planifolia]
MDISAAFTPGGTSSSSKTTLCGKPALFLNTIVSPAETVSSLGTKASVPSFPPRSTSAANALLESTNVAAKAAAEETMPRFLREAFGLVDVVDLAEEAEKRAIARAARGEGDTLIPEKEGTATAVERLTMAILVVWVGSDCWFTGNGWQSAMEDGKWMGKKRRGTRRAYLGRLLPLVWSGCCLLTW